jgi:hypothetical protein
MLPPLNPISKQDSFGTLPVFTKRSIVAGSGLTHQAFANLPNRLPQALLILNQRHPQETLASRTKPATRADRNISLLK